VKYQGQGDIWTRGSAKLCFKYFIAADKERAYPTRLSLSLFFSLPVNQRGKGKKTT